MTAEEMTEQLAECLEIVMVESMMTPELSRIETFAERGVLTLNSGLIITLADGSEYDLTVVRRR